MSIDDFAIDTKGRPLPYSSAEIRAIVRRAVDEGTLVAALLRMPSGDLAFQVFGPPSQELLDTLESVTTAYRRLLEGH
jgi:hypothetical protein